VRTALFLSTEYSQVLGNVAAANAATGTVMRPDTLRRYAADAGWSDVQILDQIQHGFLRFYLLTP
jgi:hypothetical protein